MRNGGYKIINLKDVNLTSTAAKVAGIHDDIENSFRKPLLLSGITINGVEKNDAFVAPTVSSGSYLFKVYGGTITVTSQDMVSFTADAA